MGIRINKRWRNMKFFRGKWRVRIGIKYRSIKTKGRYVLIRYGRHWKKIRRPRMRIFKGKAWRPIVRFGNHLKILLGGKRRIVKLTRRGLKYLRRKQWRKIRTRRRPNRRSKRRVRRRIRRLRRRRRRGRKNRRTRRTRRRIRFRRRPRRMHCGMRVRLYRRWRPVIRRRKHFFVRYKRILRRVTFRKAVFRIRLKGRWKTRPSYHRIKVRMNKRYRYVKRVTWKGAKRWTTKCYGKRRLIKFRRGHRIIKTKTTWTRVTRHVVMRFMYRGRKYPVVKRRNRWFIRRGKKKYSRLRLRGRRFVLKRKGKWIKVPGAYVRIKVGNRWKTVKNCCKTLRLMLKGRTRRISFRGGRVNVRRRGRMVHIRKMRRRHRAKRRSRPRKRRRGFFKRLRRRLGKKRDSITTPQDHVNEPVKPTQ